MKYIRTYENFEFKKYIVYDIHSGYVILEVVRQREKSITTKIILSVDANGVEESNDQKTFEVYHNKTWTHYILYQTDNLEDAIENAQLLMTAKNYNL